VNSGDIVLVPFPFTDLSGSKNRPAIILYSSDNDVIISFLTTQLKWKGQFDIELNPTSENGLKRTSLIRLDKITTIDKTLVLGKLGSVTVDDRQVIQKNLNALFKSLA